MKKIPLEHLGEIDADKDEMLTEAKTFIAACYGVQYKDKFSVVRYQCWKIKTMKGNLNSRFKLNNFPPTNDVIELHISTSLRNGILLNMVGIENKEGRYLIPLMFPPSTKPVPDTILKLISCNCQSSKCATNACSVVKCNYLVVNFAYVKKGDV